MNESRISLIAWSRFRLSPFDWDDGRTGWMDWMGFLLARMHPYNPVWLSVEQVIKKKKKRRGPKEEEMAPFDYLICVSFISLLARPIMAKKKSDGQLNLSGTSLSPTISIRFIPFLSFVCGAERSRFYICVQMGKDEEEGPLPRAEQLLADSKKYPHRVDRRWKEKKKRTEKFRLAFWRTHHVGQLRSTSSVMISSICGWEKKKRRRLGNGWWRRPAGERGRFRMNEWTFRYTFFSFWFQQHSLSLFFFRMAKLWFFVFVGGNASRFEYEDRDATQPKTKRPKTKRSSSSRLRESCVGRL